MISLGKGDLTSFSSNKKIEGKISMEDELIGTYDALPQFLFRVA